MSQGQVVLRLDGQTVAVSLTVSASPTAPVAQFSRITYNNVPGTPGRYRLLDMQSGTPSPATSTIASSKAAGSTVLTYAAVAVLLAGTNDSVTRLPANVTYPESCYLHDSGGNRVVVGNATYMNLADPTWQQLAAQFCASMVTRVGSDGIYLDEAATSVYWQQNLPKGIITDQQLQDGWVGTMTAIKQALPASKLLVVNIGGGAINAVGGGQTVWRRYLGVADGATEESWAYGTNGLPVGLAQWQNSLANALWCEQQGKLMICNGDDLAQDTLVPYGLCSMLLVAGGMCMFNESRGKYTAPERWLPIYDQALALGAPRAPYTVAGSVYTRQFAGGTVTVDTSAHTGTITS